ncbi:MULTISPECIES: hypothetical protein [Burkholderiaceae]|uniref:hypothetical protein n=1 Tax=Burkholderiaceae TaxID=119060 RepID=UPI0009680C36|nr:MULTISPECIES: hypothetical protein [Burkholderiaceae]MCG1019370.1 hypothetical protein [Mycetohabitans sp. B4]SIT78587.1 hypothetical protein SAMN04487768_0052 [Burkholderia sp. b13]
MIEILTQYPPAYLHSDGHQLFGRAVIAWLLAASQDLLVRSQSERLRQFLSGSLK